MQGYGQKGAVFQAAGAQGPWVTLQVVSIAGSEGSKVSPMHLPNGTGLFPKLLILQAQHISKASNSRLAMIIRELHWEPQFQATRIAVHWEMPRACSDPERDREHRKILEEEPKEKPLPSLKQSSITAMKRHYPEIPPCPSNTLVGQQGELLWSQTA